MFLSIVRGSIIVCIVTVLYYIGTVRLVCTVVSGRIIAEIFIALEKYFIVHEIFPLMVHLPLLSTV